MKWKVEPVLPGLQRHLVEQSPLGLDRGGLADDDRLRRCRGPGSRSSSGQFELRRELGELGRRHRVDRLGDVAAALRRPVRLGDAALERDDRVGLGLGIGDAGEPLHGDQIGAIGGAIGVELGALAQIIIAVGHAEPALAGAGDIMGRVGRDRG